MGGEADVGCACDCGSKEEHLHIPNKVEPPRKTYGHGVKISIPLKDKTEEQVEAFWRAETALHEAGIFFDTGSESDSIRVWEFDWSLVGLFAKCKDCKYDTRNQVKEFSKKKVEDCDIDDVAKYKQRAELGY